MNLCIVRLRHPASGIKPQRQGESELFAGGRRAPENLDGSPFLHTVQRGVKLSDVGVGSYDLPVVRNRDNALVGIGQRDLLSCEQGAQDG